VSDLEVARAAYAAVVQVKPGEARVLRQLSNVARRGAIVCVYSKGRGVGPVAQSLANGPVVPCGMRPWSSGTAAKITTRARVLVISQSTQSLRDKKGAPRVGAA
jgi:hypothetical protein